MKIKGLIFLFLVSSVSFSYAKVVPNCMISDHAVLQQLSKVNLWGTAKPNTMVRIRLSWQQRDVMTKSDGKGRWMVKVPTGKAGGPYSITFNDGQITAIKDILLGETWLCSGQSNMDMPIMGFPNQPVAGSFDVIAEASRYPIRMFTVNRKFSNTEDSCFGTWKVSTPENVARVSATAYFYALYLQKTLNVPIGIIASSWGGTSVLSWMSKESVATIRKQVVDDCVKRNSKEQNLPGKLFQSMIYPLRHYTIKGFVWYQGEHNIPEYNDYADMMSGMVRTWRNIWGDNKLPFYFVQIPGWCYFNRSDGIERGLFVENQKKALTMIPYSDMATTTDIGEEKCIHPSHKREVGQRLAACALYRAYGIRGLYSDVVHIKSVTYDKNTAKVTFVGGSFGMSAESVEGFELAGSDKVFYPAKASIVNGSVLVTSQAVEHPIAVRYAFHNYIKANLRNSLGVPYCSFRTDNW